MAKRWEEGRMEEDEEDEEGEKELDILSFLPSRTYQAGGDSSATEDESTEEEFEAEDLDRESVEDEEDEDRIALDEGSVEDNQEKVSGEENADGDTLVQRIGRLSLSLKAINDVASESSPVHQGLGDSPHALMGYNKPKEELIGSNGTFDQNQSLTPPPRQVENLQSQLGEENWHPNTSGQKEEKDDSKPCKAIRTAYNDLIKEAQTCESEGDLRNALSFYQQALSLWDLDYKLRKKITKIENLLEVRRQSRRQSKAAIREGLEVTAQQGWRYNAEDERYELDGEEPYSLSKPSYERLLPYQREGVGWLWQLHQRGAGGILGDEMGLGKTCQTITFLGGCFEGQQVSRVLIVSPVSVLSVWEGEFRKFCKDICPLLFHGSNTRERDDNLKSVCKRGGVLLTSYGLASSQAEKLGRVRWDYIVCDEGHKLKNPSIQTSKKLRTIPADHRLLLTGTPVQNNLDELWALLDFAVPGLLPPQQEFKSHYSRPIADGHDKSAAEAEKQLGERRARELRELFTPYQLARTKADVFSKETREEGAEGQKSEGGERAGVQIGLEVSKKEWIVWLELTSFQKHVYRQFLDSDVVHAALSSSRSPLAALTVLKKICDHPYLLQKATEVSSLEALREAEEEQEAEEADTFSVQRMLEAWKKQDHAIAEEALPASAAKELIGAAVASSKMLFVLHLLQELERGGHKTLVFSQSSRMLRLLRSCTDTLKISSLFLDGKVNKLADREKIVHKFNSRESIKVLFLTTGVGGVGLTLTGADRVIIYDPSWNPATDAQAVDRAYRVGQTRPVLVYRLVTCGTVEEKILRNQIFKRGLNKMVMQQENQLRYFSKQQLRALFAIGNMQSSDTHRELEDTHKEQRQRCEHEEHRAFLERCGGAQVRGVSDYHLLFSKLLPPTQSPEGDEAYTPQHGPSSSIPRKINSKKPRQGREAVKKTVSSRTGEHEDFLERYRMSDELEVLPPPPRPPSHPSAGAGAIDSPGGAGAENISSGKRDVSKRSETSPLRSGDEDEEAGGGGGAEQGFNSDSPRLAAESPASTTSSSISDARGGGGSSQPPFLWTRMRANLTVEETRRYNKHLEDGKEAEGNERYAEALAHYLRALELADDEEVLQDTVCSLGSLLFNA